MATDAETFDQWVADEGGPEAVAQMVADVRSQVDAGLLRGFTNEDEFLAYIRRRRLSRSVVG